MADQELGLGVLFYANAGNILAKINEVQTRLKTLAAEVSSFGKEGTKSSKSVDNLSNSFSGARNALRGLSTQLNTTAKGLTSTGTAAGSTGTSMENLGKSITTGASSARAAIPYYQRLGVAIRSLAAWIPAAMAITGVMTALQSGRQAVMDYSQALKNLQAITNATEAETSLMGDKIKEVASLTKYSTKEVADAMVFIGQAGFNAGEAIDTIQASAMLATGTLSSLETSSDLVTTALRVFHLSATESARVSDVFANAVNKSKTTVEGLKVALNYLGPVADSSGLSIEESAAAVMSLANAGIRASTIGTSLRQMLSRLAAPTKKMGEAFAQAGVNVKDLDVAQDGLAKTAGKLSKVLKEDVSKAFGLFGLRAANAAIILASLGERGMKFLIEQASEVGSSVRMAEKQMEGLGVASKNLRDKLELLAVSIGSGGLGAALKVLIDVLRPVVDALSTFAASTIGQLLISVGALYVAFLGLGKAVTYLGAAMVALATKSTMAASLALIRTEGVALAYVMTQLSSLFVGLQKVLAGFAYIVLYVANMFHAMIVNGLTLKPLIYALSDGFVALSRAVLAFSLSHPVLVITTLIASFYLVRKAIAENILATEKLAIVHANTAAKLQEYNKLLEDNWESEAKRNRIVQRIILDFPKLKNGFDNAGESLSAYTKILEEEIEKEKEIARRKTEEAINNVSAAWRRSADDVGRFRDMLSYASGDLNYLQLTLRQNTSTMGLYALGINTLYHWFYRIREAVAGGEGAILSWSKKLIESEADARNFENSTASLIYRLEKLGDSTKTLDLINAFPTEAQGRILEIVNRLHRFDETMQRLGQSTSQYEEQFTNFILDLGDKWADFYTNQDAQGKMFTLKHALNLKKQLNDLDQNRSQMGLTEQQYLDERLRIIEAGFKTMESDYLKEYDKMASIVEGFYKRLEAAATASYDKEKNALDLWLREKEIAIDNSLADESNKQFQKEELYADYYSRLGQLTQQFLQEEIQAIEDRLETEKSMLDDRYLSNETYQEKIKALELKAVEDTKSTYEEVLKSLRSNLEERQKAYEYYSNEVTKIEGQIYSTAVGYEDEISKLRRDALSDQEHQKALELEINKKYSDAAKLLSEGEFDKALEVYGNIKGLVKEIAVYKSKSEDETYEKKKKALEKELKDEKTYTGLTYAERSSLRQKIEGEIDRLERSKKLSNEIMVKDDEATAEAQATAMEELRDRTIAALEAKKEAYEKLKIEAKESYEEVSTKLEEVSEKIEELNQKEISLSFAVANQQLEDFKEKLKAMDYTVRLNFVGSASSEKPLLDKIVEIETALEALNFRFGEMSDSFEVVMSFTGEVGAGRQTLLTAIEMARDQLFSLQQYVDEMVLLIKADNTEAKNRIDEITELLKELTRRTWTVTVDIIVKGWEELVKAAAAWSTLKDKTVTVTINTKHTSSGSGYSYSGQQEGGPIPGYGGGDTVPAMLEKGEYVLRKEAVRSVGMGFVNWLNKGKFPTSLLAFVRKFKSGGPVMPFSIPEGFKSLRQKGVNFFDSVGRAAESAANMANDRKGTTEHYSSGSMKSAYDQATSGFFSNVSRAVQNAFAKKAVSAADASFPSLNSSLGYEEGGPVEGNGNSLASEIIAALRPGEWVIPRDIVAKKGAAFFSNLMAATNNYRLPKYHDGGPVGGNGLSLSGQVHTINMTINGERHTLYGDDANINRLVTNLRRAQLVKV